MAGISDLLRIGNCRLEHGVRLGPHAHPERFENRQAGRILESDPDASPLTAIDPGQPPNGVMGFRTDLDGLACRHSFYAHEHDYTEIIQTVKGSRLMGISLQDMIWGKISMKTSFAEWLLNQMKHAGLNQSELARRANVNQTVISRLLNEKAAPSTDTLRALAKVFGLPADQVFREAGILPQKGSKNEIIEQIEHVTDGLPEEEQQNVLEYALLRKRLAEEREKYEPVSKSKKRPATSG